MEEVIIPIFKNEQNVSKFPQCVGDGKEYEIMKPTLQWSFSDIKRQIHELKTTVYQIRGHIKGKTLLPFPQGAADDIEDEEIKVRESDGKDVNLFMKNNIEGIIIKWAHQVDEVLSMECDKELEEGRHPGPMVEIEFWEAKCRNLESLFEQMKNSTTRNMASILNVTDSAYYPCFK